MNFNVQMIEGKESSSKGKTIRPATQREGSHFISGTYTHTKKQKWNFYSSGPTILNICLK